MRKKEIFNYLEDFNCMLVDFMQKHNINANHLRPLWQMSEAVLKWQCVEERAMYDKIDKKHFKKINNK